MRAELLAGEAVSEGVRGAGDPDRRDVDPAAVKELDPLVGGRAVAVLRAHVVRVGDGFLEGDNDRCSRGRPRWAGVTVDRPQASSPTSSNRKVVGRALSVCA